MQYHSYSLVAGFYRASACLFYYHSLLLLNILSLYVNFHRSMIYLYFTYCDYFVALCHVKEPDSSESGLMADNIGNNIQDADGDSVTVNETNRESVVPAEPTDDYMPVKRIVSDKEQMKYEELRQQTAHIVPPMVQVKTVPTAVFNIPIHLMAYAFDVGDVSSFPPSKKDDLSKIGWITGCPLCSYIEKNCLDDSHVVVQRKSCSFVCLQCFYTVYYQQEEQEHLSR